MDLYKQAVSGSLGLEEEGQMHLEGGDKLDTHAVPVVG